VLVTIAYYVTGSGSITRSISKNVTGVGLLQVNTGTGNCSRVVRRLCQVLVTIAYYVTGSGSITRSISKNVTGVGLLPVNTGNCSRKVECNADLKLAIYVLGQGRNYIQDHEISYVHHDRITAFVKVRTKPVDVVKTCQVQE